MAFCRNGYFILLGNAGIRHSDSESSIRNYYRPYYSNEKILAADS